MSLIIKFVIPEEEWNIFTEKTDNPSNTIRNLIKNYPGESPLSQIMGVHEAAELWGLKPGYIKNLCANGTINSTKIGNNWIILIDQPNPKKEDEWI